MTKIPKADIFAVVSNSFLDGFLSMCHTRLHCKKNDFDFVENDTFSFSIKC